MIAGTFLVIARRATVKLISSCRALAKLWAQQFTQDSEEIGKTRKSSICGLKLVKKSKDKRDTNY